MWSMLFIKYIFVFDALDKILISLRVFKKLVFIVLLLLRFVSFFFFVIGVEVLGVRILILICFEIFCFFVMGNFFISIFSIFVKSFFLILSKSVLSKLFVMRFEFELDVDDGYWLLFFMGGDFVGYVFVFDGYVFVFDGYTFWSILREIGVDVFLDNLFKRVIVFVFFFLLMMIL